MNWQTIGSIIAAATMVFGLILTIIVQISDVHRGEIKDLRLVVTEHGTRIGRLEGVLQTNVNTPGATGSFRAAQEEGMYR